MQMLHYENHSNVILGCTAPARDQISERVKYYNNIAQ